MSYTVTVSDECIGCGECSDICPTDVLIMEDGMASPVEMDECIGCRSCEETCPTDAIVVKG